MSRRTQQRLGTASPSPALGWQRAAIDSRPRSPAPIEDVLASAGRPLDGETRARMESRLPRDFSRVRIHTDAQAAESARTVNARAYTVGTHIVFGAGEYAPNTRVGSELLAHELTHTIQQASRAIGSPGALRVSDPADAAERQADASVQAIREGRSAPPIGGADVVIARQQASPAPPTAAPAQAAATPPSGSRYAALPAPLRETLLDSFDAHIPDAEDYLQNAFWRKPDPTTVWEALDRFETGALAAIVQVYERVSAIPGLWSHVLYIKRAWTGGAPGIEIDVQGFGGLFQVVSGSDLLCKDLTLQQSMHKGQECWREVATARPGLHVCLDRRGGAAGTVHEIHIDPHQYVVRKQSRAFDLLARKDVLGACAYDADPTGGLGGHAQDVTGGARRTIFERYDAARKDVRTLRQTASSSPSFVGELSAIEAQLDQLMPFMRDRAVRGAAGERDAERATKMLGNIERHLAAIHGRRLETSAGGFP